MATYGLEGLIVAAIEENPETGETTYEKVTHEGGMIEISVKWTIAEDKLIVDNAVKESARKVTSGTMTITTDHITPQLAKVLYGIELNEIKDDEQKTIGIETSIGSDDSPNPVAISGIISGQLNNIPIYRAYFYPKVMFSPSDIDAATMEEGKINWKTPKIEATIMKKLRGNFAYEFETSTKEAAINWIDGKLGNVAPINKPAAAPIEVK